MSFQDMDVFNGHLVLTMTKEGLPMLCSINLPIHPYCKVCNINSLCCTSPEINLFFISSMMNTLMHYLGQ